ncbi:hypothetical protein ACQP25_44930 (plasmid) [Microtetraspora malaysiensis]|uniref:hypothetical protein n=1 Tax=Microtetraspora malaysiensis TaxID=161358 RepID=UPI003D936964
MRRSIRRRRTPLPTVAFPRAAALYASGHSLAKVAEEYATTTVWVKRAVEAQGGSVRPPGGRTVPGRPFDLQRARELYAGGKTIRQIADLLGDSRCRVHVRLRAAGVPMRDMTAPRAARLTPAKREAIIAACKAGKTTKQICLDLRTSATTVTRVLDESGITRRVRHRLDHQRMKALRAKGWTYRQIGDDQGTSPQYAWRVVNDAYRRKREREAAMRENAGCHDDATTS